MKIEINLLHLFAAALSVIAGLCGLPWFICLPFFLVLFTTAIRFTKFLYDLDTNDDE